MEYSKEIQKVLQKEKIEIGHRVAVDNGKEHYEGLLMQKSSGDDNTVIIKLDNGYNVGVEFTGAKIKKLHGEMQLKPVEKQKYVPEKGKKNISILHTGGTVASRIDYKTGAVSASITPEEMIRSVPELAEIANIKTHIIFQMFSEDFEPEHWEKLAEAVETEISTGADGVIITHGTDTMHYSSAALSFALRNLPIPVLFVGSQRSSDRGSSDAGMNLICAAQFIEKTNFAGVAVCMHATQNDDYCYISSGVNVKKMHTSRRDAFRSIDTYPLAKVTRNGEIEFFTDTYMKVDLERKVELFNKFETKVALVKLHPGFNPKILEFYEKQKFHGIVLEGTGLGHAPVNVTDKDTEQHKETLKIIKRLSEKMIIGMTSQCAYGRVNMNVYSTGRLLQEAGVLSLAMLPETAFVKLSWALGNEKNIKKAQELLTSNYEGEIVDKIDPRVFLF